MNPRLGFNYWHAPLVLRWSHVRCKSGFKWARAMNTPKFPLKKKYIFPLNQFKQKFYTKLKTAPNHFNNSGY